MPAGDPGRGSPGTFFAVLFDLGGVVLDGPMASFAAYEREAGLPDGIIRAINSVNPDTNAWAQAERGEISPSTFAVRFRREANALGHDLDPQRVLDLLHGEVRPAMVTALRSLRASGIRLAALTNNMEPTTVARSDLGPMLDLFDVVVESSKEGVRKPEIAFFEVALTRLGVPPDRCVFLDDLGINLKPARQLGMTTIKVVDEDDALAELGRITGVDVRAAG